MPNGSALWDRAVVCRPTHPKTAHLQLSEFKTFLYFLQSITWVSTHALLGASTRACGLGEGERRAKAGPGNGRGSSTIHRARANRRARVRGQGQPGPGPYGRCRKQGNIHWPVQDRRRGLTLTFPFLFSHGRSGCEAERLAEVCRSTEATPHLV